MVKNAPWRRGSTRTDDQLDHTLAITDRRPFADGISFADTGPYERRTGRALFAIDPRAEANAWAMDIDKASTDERGLVRFAADIIVLRPVEPERGNRRIFFDLRQSWPQPCAAILQRCYPQQRPDHPGTGRQQYPSRERLAGMNQICGSISLRTWLDSSCSSGTGCSVTTPNPRPPLAQI